MVDAGARHTRRVYYTFDISAVRGSDTKQIYVDDAPTLASAQFLFPDEPVFGTPGTFTFRAPPR